MPGFIKSGNILTESLFLRSWRRSFSWTSRACLVQSSASVKSRNYRRMLVSVLNLRRLWVFNFVDRPLPGSTLCPLHTSIAVLRLCHYLRRNERSVVLNPAHITPYTEHRIHHSRIKPMTPNLRWVFTNSWPGNLYLLSKKRVPKARPVAVRRCICSKRKMNAVDRSNRVSWRHSWSNHGNNHRGRMGH